MQRFSTILIPALLGLPVLPVLAGPPGPGLRLPPLMRASAGAPVQRRGSRLEELERWVAEFQRNGPATSPERVQRLAELTSGLRMEALSSPRRRNAITLGLLDLAGVRTAETLRAARRSGKPPVPDPQTLRIRVYGERELRTLLVADREHELATWLASSVLVRATQPEARRLAALALLREAHIDPTQLALFYCTRDPSHEVREAALKALAGWDDEAVHEVMLRQLELLDAAPDWLQRSTIRRHFGAVSLDMEQDSGKQLYALTRAGMVAPDWRRAFRALQLIPAVPDDPAVPALIDGLSLWIARREGGAGSRRIENEIAHELERRSGKHIGIHPQRWKQWWKVMREQAAAGADGSGGEGLVVQLEDRTTASFFGLRPVTDRVVFVIDRSRSMLEPFGTSEMTRYSEAIEQMMRFLADLGPQTRFRVVVFSTDFQVWKKHLQPATEGNLRAAKRWLRYRGPDGGTFLEPAIRDVLHLGDDGRPDLARLEADTVIVLCDGETSEGPGWVPALLRGPNEEAALAFHAVQIGGSDDGTLRALAEGSGGDFVRVAP